MTSPFSPPRWPALARLSGLGALLLAGPAGLRAAEWQSLLANTPFGTAPVTPAAAAGELEFRGVVQEEEVYLINLYNPATKTAQWIPVNWKTPGLEIKSYDAVSSKVEIMQAGRPLTLQLKRARIAQAGNAAPLPLANPANPAEPAPGAEAAHPPEFMRNLPPDARKMLEEVRRRRAIREPFPAGTPAPAADNGPDTPPPPPPPAAP